MAVRSINPDGTYSVTGLPADRYNVAFSEFSGSAEGQWYSNAFAYQTASIITLAAGQAVPGINATLVKGGTISGKLTAPPGVNLSSVHVQANRTGLPVPGPPDGTSVQADGTYRCVGVTAGTYKLKSAAGTRERWTTGTTTVNAALTKAATISGKVTVPVGNEKCVQERCRSGQRLEYWKVPGRDHGGIVAPDSPLTKPLITWTQDRFSKSPTGRLSGENSRAVITQ
jgi:hypothetical protein